MSVDLCRRLILQDKQVHPDDAGGYHEAWVDLGEVWADVSARSGRDAGAPGAHLARTAYRIVVRGAPVGHSARPRAGQRFVENGRVFNIQAVADRDPRGRYLTCYAEEEVAA